jgi:Asp/Glu/hydantoin racemase
MRVLVIIPAAKGVHPPDAEQRRIDVIKSYERPGFEITVDFPAEESGFNPYGGEYTSIGLARNHMLMAQRMIQGEKEGYDACIPFGMIDFGVEIARSACNIPIVAQAQSTYCVAASMVNRIGIITYQSANHSATWKQLKEYGFTHMVAGLGAVEMKNNDMPKNKPQLFERFVAEGKRLVKEGAELIVCHGMSMAPVNFAARDYIEALGVPVLEGMGCAAVMARSWVELGTPYSRLRYRAAGE